MGPQTLTIEGRFHRLLSAHSPSTEVRLPLPLPVRRDPGGGQGKRPGPLALAAVCCMVVTSLCLPASHETQEVAKASTLQAPAFAVACRQLHVAAPVSSLHTCAAANDTNTMRPCRTACRTGRRTAVICSAAYSHTINFRPFAALRFPANPNTPLLLLQAYKAACTPEFYVFDSDLKLTYHGQVGAREGQGRGRGGTGRAGGGAKLTYHGQGAPRGRRWRGTSFLVHSTDALCHLPPCTTHRSSYRYGESCCA